MAFKDSQVALKADSQLEDFSNNAIAKSLSMKNRRATDNWQQLVKAIETQKSEKSAELNQSRNRLLNKRDEIQARTVSLSRDTPAAFQEKGKPAFLKVYDSLMASMGKPEKRMKSGIGVARQTQSSERKKVVRKNVSYSLNELQKLGTKASLKSNPVAGELENIGQNDDSTMMGQSRPDSVFDFTEEEKDLSRKLYCFPTALPRIHLQASHRPSFRSFAKDDAEFRRRMSIDEESAWKNIHQCRHLRLQQRSHTVHDLRRASSTVKST